jgi:hypothetical protein
MGSYKYLIINPISILTSLWLIMPAVIDVNSQNSEENIVQAAQNFLNALSVAKHEKVLYQFNDNERFSWHYIPKLRKGLTIKELKGIPRKAAEQLLSHSMSASGFEKSRDIIEYNNTQKNANHIHTVIRDPENDFGLDLLKKHYQDGDHH